MSTEHSEKITCTECNKSIDISAFLAHLMDHVSIEFQKRFDENLTPDDTAQIHDLIVSRYDDLRYVDIEIILNDFKDTRVLKVLEYRPLSIVLYHSDEDGYFMLMDLARISMGSDRERAVNNTIRTINKYIDQNLEDGYYNIQISGVASPTCHWFSYHMKVPSTWLGAPVVIQKNGKGVEHPSKPVMCGNSVHVTVPKEWSEEKVSVRLVHIDDESQLTEMNHD